MIVSPEGQFETVADYVRAASYPSTVTYIEHPGAIHVAVTATGTARIRISDEAGPAWYWRVDEISRTGYAYGFDYGYASSLEEAKAMATESLGAIL